MDGTPSNPDGVRELFRSCGSVREYSFYRVSFNVMSCRVFLVPREFRGALRFVSSNEPGLYAARFLDLKCVEIRDCWSSRATQKISCVEVQGSSNSLKDTSGFFAEKMRKVDVVLFGDRGRSGGWVMSLGDVGTLVVRVVIGSKSLFGIGTFSLMRFRQFMH